MLRLRVIDSEGERSLRILADARVGREPSCDVTLHDPQVSRVHLRIRRLNTGTFVVEDAGSRNGARCNGERLEGQRLLRPGDVVSLGSSRLEVEVVGADEGIGESSDSTSMHSSGSSPIPDGQENQSFVPTLTSTRWVTVLRSVLPVQRPLLRLATMGVGAFALLLLCFASLRSGAAESAASLRLEAAAESVFGFDPGADVHARSRLDFSWSPSAELSKRRFILRFESLHEAGEDGFEVHLNGTPFATVDGSGEGWVEQELVLPVQLVRLGDSNTVTFLHRMNQGGGEDSWMLAELEVDEVLLPDCDRHRCLAEASERIEKGELLLSRREIDPSNLVGARLAFRDALLYLEALEQKPDAYAVAYRRLQEAEADLAQRCKDMRFRVIRSLAFGDPSRAVEEAERMARFFSGAQHACHARALRLLDLLQG